MNIGIVLRYCLAGILFVSSAAALHAATAFPFLTPIRTEVLTEIALLNESNEQLTAADRTRLRSLLQARNALTRRGRATLANDLQILTTVATLLERSFPNGEFSPLLEDAIAQYRAVLISTVTTLEADLDRLPASARRNTAQNTLEFVNLTLDQVDAAPTAAAAARFLTRSSIRLLAVQTLTTRLLREANRPVQMTAFADGMQFRSTPATTTASYNPDLGLLTVTGTQTSGIRESRTITLSMSDVREGTTTHQFSSVASGTYALYTRRATNVVGFTSTSGSAIVTVDSSAGTVSGFFSFNGASAIHLERAASISGGNFFVRLRATELGNGNGNGNGLGPTTRSSGFTIR